jgi:hypothetical protein
MQLQVSARQNGSVNGKNGAVSPERRIVELSSAKLLPERSLHQPEEPTFGYDAKLRAAENGKVRVNILGC